VCEPDRTNVSAGGRENARGATQKTGDANYHLSPWILNEAGARCLREFIEEMKASGFVATGLERSGQGDATVVAKVPVE
jgi:hypothetical protein